MADTDDLHPSTRRRFLAGGAGFLGATVLAPGAALGLSRRRALLSARPDLTRPNREQAAALRALGRRSLRAPGSLPNPGLPAGTDTMPQIEHVVAVMMENHSYDNLLGMLGREPWELPRGDGFTLAADGHPANFNPQANGTPLRAFRMPTTCQFDGKPSQEWMASHVQYANGTNQGFVISGSGQVAMGYWQREDLPFFYSLADTFPIGDRFFCSVLGQTDPNRRYWIAATSSGMTDDIPDPTQDATLAAAPANGTIFNSLSSHNIVWTEYATDTSQTACTPNLYPTDDAAYHATNLKTIDQFYTDAAAGALPQYCIVEPDFGKQSQENPQNIVLGEQFLFQVIEAVGKSPKWGQTIILLNYDEHGGYYDHVPPPVAMAPDGVAPVVQSGESTYDGFSRYGFRVPAIVISPYAKQNYVSSVVYDHASVLAFVERKFNLPALTYRDANANDMTDFLDLQALAAGKPTFPEFPALAASSYGPATLACSTSGPGTIPVPEPAALPIQVRVTSAHSSPSKQALIVKLQASRAGLGTLTVRLMQGKQSISHVSVHKIDALVQTVPLRQHGKAPKPGHYTLEVLSGTKVLVKKTLKLG